ncbi:MAG: hypothetical protein CSA63_00955 [Propionibacterium sp.]|nr:MAG: hypothetical protein CSA63_00955 [Propionibacterium sp.]
MFHPTLTAIEQDVTTTGYRAVEMLIECINGYDGSARRERIPVTIHYCEASGSHIA